MSNSKSQLKFHEIIRDMIRETGVNPAAIYCQSTGAIIGYINATEKQLIWDSLDPKLDQDDIIDELYSRTIASMRPSPAWNYLSKGTMNRLRVSNPIRLASYLLCRYFEPRDSVYSRVKRTFEQRISDGITKIKTHQKLSERDYDILKMKELVTALLMLDASFDLSEIDLIPGFPKSPLDINLDVIDQYVKTLTDHYGKLCDTKAKLERKAQLESHHLGNGGNRMTRDAAAKAFMEIKPKSEATIKKEHQTEMDILMANLLRELMDKESTRVEQHVNTAKTFKPGLKLNALKKAVQS